MSNVKTVYVVEYQFGRKPQSYIFESEDDADNFAKEVHEQCQNKGISVNVVTSVRCIMSLDNALTCLAEQLYDEE